MAHHLSDHNRSLDAVKRNIDAWWPFVEQGIEAIVITASGCGVMVKDYAHLLAEDAVYAEKAARISVLARDISEVLSTEDLRGLKVRQAKHVAFHSPCTLQHGQKLNGLTEDVLRGLGFELKPVVDSHLCCGSAGTLLDIAARSKSPTIQEIRSNHSRPPERLLLPLPTWDASFICPPGLITRLNIGSSWSTKLPSENNFADWFT